MDKVDYSSSSTPPDYICANCGATGVKLWRETQTYQTHLLCTRCAAKASHKDISDIDANGTIALKHRSRIRIASIGWMIPAIPDEEGVGYWGYLSAPDEAWKWWESLPTMTTMKDKVNYLSSSTPSFYKCAWCGAAGVKLWHMYNVIIHDHFLCARCAAKKSHEDISDIDANGTIKSDFVGRTNKLGYYDTYVPAIPTLEAEETHIEYWSYSSVPEQAWKWWESLPTLTLDRFGNRMWRMYHALKRKLIGF